MRLLIVTPLDARSAIGRVSVAVGEALAGLGHEVRFLRSEMKVTPGEAVHQTALPVLEWRGADWEALRKSTDLALVNIGDNYALHAGIFDALEALPSLGVFHDFYLYNLFSGWTYYNQHDWVRHDADIVAVYGEEARSHARGAHSGELDMAGIAAAIPMTEWIARRCDGAVSHADFYRNRLEAVCAGPVIHIPLCGPDRLFPKPKPSSDGRLTVVTVGVMNRNKCADAVIDALGASDRLRARVRYRLVGAIEDSERGRLTTLAQEQGVLLAIEGAASEEGFAAALSDADIICCLRKPVLEGASGSVIDAMLSGRPVIVADAGFYGEQPDDLVFKIAPTVDTAELCAMLERLAGDAPLRDDVGRRARKYAVKAFSPATYAEKMEQAARATCNGLALLKVGRDLGVRLSALKVPAADAAAERIGARLQALFTAPADG